MLDNRAQPAKLDGSDFFSVTGNGKGVKQRHGIPMAPSAPVLFDLHLHTTRHSPDGEMNPFALCRRASKLGLHGIVITEHDWLWTEQELAELRAANPRLAVYAGVEVSAAEGHFLCYGIRDPLRIPKGIAASDLCAEVHRQQGAVLAAHPYRWGQDFDAIVGSGLALDGSEIYSLNMQASDSERAAEHWRARRWTGLGNSDAHRLEDVAFCFTEFATRPRDQADLIEALRSGQATPRRKLDLNLFPDSGL